MGMFANQINKWNDIHLYLLALLISLSSHALPFTWIHLRNLLQGCKISLKFIGKWRVPGQRKTHWTVLLDEAML